MIKVSIHSKLELLTCFSVKSKKLNKFGPIMSVCCGGNSLFLLQFKISFSQNADSFVVVSCILKVNP